MADHCVQGSKGAEFHDELHVSGLVSSASAIIRKGMSPNVDSYSAFYENDKKTPTGLSGLLKDLGVTQVFFVGLAYDFCVGYSALDAVQEGFDAIVVKDLTRAIGMPLKQGTTVDAIEEQFASRSVVLVNSVDLGLQPSSRPSTSLR